MAGKKVLILLNAIYVSLTQKREGHITAWEFNIVLYWSQFQKKKKTGHFAAVAWKYHVIELF